MSIFEKASRQKIRFQFHGVATVDDLWDMSLQSLDAIYAGLSAEVQQKNQASLLNTKTKEDDILDLKIEIVKHIFAVKSAEKQARVEAAMNMARQKKILGIIADKKDEALRSMPIEELEKLVAQA
ncbi:hypothetical protein JZU46_03160 [bacterium]|nr:hypothetical protein [bacterium]